MNPWPISPIGTQDLDFAVVNYDFTGLTAGELGPLPTLEVAMDLQLLDIGTSLADQAVLIASMDGTFDDFANMLNEVGSDDFDTVLGGLSGSAATGDSLLNDYTTLVTPSNGGSGGSGGGGGGGAQQCAIVDFGAIPVTGPLGSTRVKQTMQLQNTGSDALKIISHSFSPDLGFTFELDPNVDGAVLQPGDAIAITVLFTPGSVGSYQSTLTLNTNRANPQPCLSLSGSGVPGSPVGGGGPRCPTGELVFPGKHTIRPECA